MSADPVQPSRWIISCVLVFLLVSVVVSSSSSSSPLCIDGTYLHEGRNCCLCAPGLEVEQHCTASQYDRKCKACEPGTFLRDPNDQKCKRCKSCSHPNANLEEDEPCTAVRERKCRCIKDHYCPKSTEICTLCYPCKTCGAEGIKVACMVNNNTICNDETEESHIGRTVGIVVGIIVVLVLVAVVLFFWVKRRRSSVQLSSTNGNDVEMQPLKDMDLQPYMSDIAHLMGWKDMQDVAMRSNMQSAAIDSFKLSHPGDSQEQTLQLLRAWAENQGREAGKNLIELLQKNGKKSKAEKVMQILSRDK